MSAKAPRTSYYLSYRHSPHAFLRLRSLRAFSTTGPLSAYKPAKAPTTFDKEGGLLSSYRTKTLAKQLIQKRARYPLSITHETSWTQMEMVKMGIPSRVRESCIEFAFFGQVHQESPKARMQFWKDTHGKLVLGRSAWIIPLTGDTLQAGFLSTWLQSKPFTLLIAITKQPK